MAYSKQTWDTTSYVNPTRMNHIEDGIKSVDNNSLKVTQTPTSTSDNKAFRVLVSHNNSDTEENNTVQKATKLTVNAQSGALINYGAITANAQNGTARSGGTEGTVGTTMLTLGNNIAYPPSEDGGEGNSKGIIRMYGSGSNYVQFTTPNNTITGDRTYQIPFKPNNSVLAFTSDIATTRYLKKSESTGNKFYLQGKTNTWFKVCFAYSEYNILFTSAFSYNTVAKIGGETVEVTVNTETGVVAFSGNNSSIRNNTNVLVEEIPV